MKVFYLTAFSFIFSTNILLGQIVEIKGFAFSSSENQRVNVQINDTINKLIRLDKIDLLSNFSKNQFKKLITQTNRRGKFKIKAHLDDSLSFRAHLDLKKTYAVSDLINKDTVSIQLEKKTCWNECKENVELIIIRGRKLNFKKSRYDDCEYGSINSNWEAIYSVDSILQGNYNNDTIKFKVSVHARQPTVQNYDNVILYIYKKCDLYTMLRNGFDPIYKTKTKKWAGIYTNGYLSKIPLDIRPKAKHLDFNTPVEIKFHKSWDDDYISNRWYEPYYSVKDRKAIANYGFYVNDLINIRIAYINSINKR